MVQLIHTGERIRLSLERWGSFGEALARYDGREVLVFGGIPGEEVVAEVIKCRAEYTAALVVDVLDPSPHRVTPPCPYFGLCTGCQWQHIDYSHQLEIKRQMVLDALGHVGGFDTPHVSATVASTEQFGYRNHARFTVGRRHGDLGYVNRRSRRFVLIERCLLMHPWINEAVTQLQSRCTETSQLSLRYGVNTGDFLIQPALKNHTVPLSSGQKHYRESIGDREFRIAASSFFQVNTRQTERMVELVKDGLQLSGRGLIVDAYAGVGTFAILLAPYAEKVIAIEESSSAVDDATANAKDVDGIQFLRGKTEDLLAQIEERPHGVVLDPPRAGCNPTVLEALIRLAPRRVVYVSCDPESLARDLKHLCQGHFQLEQVQPIDMFPQTHHVECVATLSWAGYGSEFDLPHGDSLTLASTSPRRRELLSCLGLQFRVLHPSAVEDVRENEAPQQMVERLALSKAESVAQSLSWGMILGADSVVVLDGRVLGKPAGAAEARGMLWCLRGRVHEVITGLALINASDRSVRVASRSSVVTMREYSDDEIEAYIASGEPMDKAGAYAVQDMTFRPVASLEGCYTNVMGLPLCLLVDLLRDTGFELEPGTRFWVPDQCIDCPLVGHSRP